jgi:hypothetical protein
MLPVDGMVCGEEEQKQRLQRWLGKSVGGEADFSAALVTQTREQLRSK